MASDELSQEQIDELVQQAAAGREPAPAGTGPVGSPEPALSAGEGAPAGAGEAAAAAEAASYDFHRPSRFSRDQLRAFQRIHDHFARELANYLASAIRTNVEAQVEAIAELTADEFQQFLRALPALSAVAIFSLAPVRILGPWQTEPGRDRA